jgi:hypothetical protein
MDNFDDFDYEAEIDPEEDEAIRLDAWESSMRWAYQNANDIEFGIEEFLGDDGWEEGED